MIELIVKARHFKDAVFLSTCDCALANAAKDQFSTIHVVEDVDQICINDDLYLHDRYSHQFDDDKEKARSLKFSDEVIRTIQLTPIN